MKDKISKNIDIIYEEHLRKYKKRLGIREEKKESTLDQLLSKVNMKELQDRFGVWRETK